MFKPWSYTAVFPSLLLEDLLFSLFLPLCLLCSDCSFLSQPFFIKSQPCTWLLVQPPKHLSHRGLCLVLVLAVPVKKVSAKRDGRGLAGKLKCCSGISVGDCISVGMLHVSFLQFLSQIPSCQTVLQQLVKQV